MVYYGTSKEYDPPHGKDLQAWFQTGSKIIHVENDDLWIVREDGGAILFTDYTVDTHTRS